MNKSIRTWLRGLGRGALLCGLCIVMVSCPVLSPETLNCVQDGNGCGPILLGPVVPLFANRFRLSCGPELVTVCFTCPCNGHDTCYGTCGSDKTDCDLTFLRTVLEVCDDTLEENCVRSGCVQRAFLYSALVSVGGFLSFNDGQIAACSGEGMKAGTAVSLPPFPVKGLPFDLPYEDADGDLLPDDWERRVGLDPSDPLDATIDYDGDGLGNHAEFIISTDPFVADSDGDGADDLQAFFELNGRG